MPLLIITSTLVLGTMGVFRVLSGREPRPPIPARPVSMGFASWGDPRTPIDPTRALAVGEPYYFWIELGRPPVETTRAPGAPPPETVVSVALFAFAEGVQISTVADVGTFRLPANGPGVVIAQPAAPPQIPQGDALLGRRMFFPVRAPGRAGIARLRCNIYHEQVLIQARLVRVRVARSLRSPAAVLGGLAAWAFWPRSFRPIVDYRLSWSLDPGHLLGIPPHLLSVMLNGDSNGTHQLRFFGSNGPRRFKEDSTLDAGDLERLTKAARETLRYIAWGSTDEWREGRLYRFVAQRDRKQVTADLARLAQTGYTLYDAIINRLAGGYERCKDLEDLIRRPGLVQIALKRSARLALPAEMMYDYAIDTSVKPSRFSLCPTFAAALEADSPLATCACFSGNCPSTTGGPAGTVVCPSGFWGFRHGVGMPLSIEKALDVPTHLRYEATPQAVIGVCTDERFALRAAHEAALRELVGEPGWAYADSREKVFELLKATKPHLVYFYCHGGLEKDVPYLRIGPLDSPVIKRTDLRRHDVRWTVPRPLVFINGCETINVRPEQAVEFISGFIENAAAAGVIGTGITVFEPLARSFAEECLARFLRGERIGLAVRDARLELLRLGNPLGLAYIPFVTSGLRLVRTEMEVPTRAGVGAARARPVATGVTEPTPAREAQAMRATAVTVARPGCPGCGQPGRVGAHFCSSCGQRMST